MKRLILFFLITLLTLIFIFTFAGCDMLLGDLGGTGGGGNNDDDPPQIDNETDLDVFVPQPEDGGYVEGETYYKSNSVSLVTEVNGNYSIDRPFTLDKDDESKRIYHNLYLYEGDFSRLFTIRRTASWGKSLPHSATREIANMPLLSMTRVVTPCS